MDKNAHVSLPQRESLDPRSRKDAGLCPMREEKGKMVRVWIRVLAIGLIYDVNDARLNHSMDHKNLLDPILI
jgi:hypothetical protein